MGGCNLPLVLSPQEAACSDLSLQILPLYCKVPNKPLLFLAFHHSKGRCWRPSTSPHVSAFAWVCFSKPSALCCDLVVSLSKDFQFKTLFNCFLPYFFTPKIYNCFFFIFICYLYFSISCSFISLSILYILILKPFLDFYVIVIFNVN